MPATTWFASMTPVMQVAAVVACVLGLASALVAVQVLLLAQTGSRRAARRARMESTWRPWVVAAGLEANDARGNAGGLPHPPRSRQEFAWFLQLWNQLQSHLRGTAHARLTGLLVELGFDRRALGLLSAGDLREQLIALATLRHLADPRHWTQLEALLHARSAIVSLAAAEAMVAIDATRAIATIVPLALQRRDWSLNRLDFACRQAGADAVTPVLVQLLAVPAPPWARARLLELLRHGDALALAGWARGSLDAREGGDAGASDDLERIAALHVLGRLRSGEDRPRISRALDAAPTAVRLAALRALCQQAMPGDADQLATLLADRDWAVRQAAADGLVSLPGLPPGMLGSMLDRIEDRYGREALARALAERAA
jgi:hypothetical protein